MAKVKCINLECLKITGIFEGWFSSASLIVNPALPAVRTSDTSWCTVPFSVPRSHPRRPRPRCLHSWVTTFSPPVRYTSKRFRAILYMCHSSRLTFAVIIFPQPRLKRNDREFGHRHSKSNSNIIVVIEPISRPNFQSESVLYVIRSSVLVDVIDLSIEARQLIVNETCVMTSRPADRLCVCMCVSPVSHCLSIHGANCLVVRLQT